MHGDLLRQTPGTNLDLLGGILAVTADDRVGQGFRQGDAKPESQPIRRAVSGEAVAGYQLDRFLDPDHIAGQPQVDLDGEARRRGDLRTAYMESEWGRHAGNRYMLEIGQRLFARIRDGEQGIEFGEFEQGTEVFVQPSQAQFTALLPDLLGNRDQRAQP